MDLKNIDFTDFIRYILSGLNFILFVILLPMIYYVPSQLANFMSETSVLLVLLFSVAIGYLLDMLKVYQFAPNFNKKKAEFRKEISDVLGIPIREAGSYFSITSKMWDENSSYNFERRRAEWMLILHTSATLLISLFVWLGFTINDYFNNGISTNLYEPVIIAVLIFLLALRLYWVGKREIEKHDIEFLLIMKMNKWRIKNAWKLLDNK